MAAVDFHGDADLCGHALFVDSFRDSISAIQSAVVSKTLRSFRLCGRSLPVRFSLSLCEPGLESIRPLINMELSRSSGEQNAKTSA